MSEIFFIDGGICCVDGFSTNACKAGIKKDALDLAVIKAKEPCEWAGVFTDNELCSASVTHARSKMGQKIDGVIVNSGNANAMTGAKGMGDVEKVTTSLQGNWLMSSTGVIGVRLDSEKITKAINGLDLSICDGEKSAKAIMTTDRYEKTISLECQSDDGVFRIGAMAKGAGMIAPSMATMLCFVTTDVNLAKDDLQDALVQSLDVSFNAISVDGDMSTNDSIILMSSQKSTCRSKADFIDALKIVLHKLALDVVKDGEGAKKLVAFEVLGAKDDDDARKVAVSLSKSLLVKTALFGEDPNWGRIASTIGANTHNCREDSLKISYDEVCVYDGEGLMDEEIEKKAQKVLAKNEFRISCELGIANGSFTAYGCDLGHEYVRINADYRS